jgi:methyltransferase (TIGR00027 family)
MRVGKPSRTAEYMALFRAVESCRAEHLRLFTDPFAIGFLTSGLRATVTAARLPGLRSLVPRAIDHRAPGPRISALVRTRMIDDALTGALAEGARQVVILGAGYDSRAYRIKGIEHAHVFEVDHPTTQTAKRRRLVRMLGVLPSTVTFVAVDFMRADFGPLLMAAGYDVSQRAFFIWEGVTNYLDDDAVDGTLRWIAEHSAPDSRLSFTYVDRGLLDGSKSFPGSEQWVASVRKAGEPFTFGLEPATLAPYLAERGMQLLSDVSTADALTYYGRRASGELPPPGFYRVALAEVAGRRVKEPCPPPAHTRTAT